MFFLGLDNSTNNVGQTCVILKITYSTTDNVNYLLPDVHERRKCISSITENSKSFSLMESFLSLPV